MSLTRFAIALLVTFLASATWVVAQRDAPPAAARAVYIDGEGVVRWRDDRREVALFGANYVLPTASDYRAAGYLHADRKRMIDEDMAHFARMGWDGLRLTFWGDWEASDSAGNLIANDHLDLQDYLIARARERGIYMLFSPIQLYGSNWPDALAGHHGAGLRPALRQGADGHRPGRHRRAGELPAPDPGAREPLHRRRAQGRAGHPLHRAGERAVAPPGGPRRARSATSTPSPTRCAAPGAEKLVFYNVSQDFRIGEAIRRSRAQGVTFGWYPTGLNSRSRAARATTSAASTTFPTCCDPSWPRLPRIVYEFDSPDLRTGTMYPAMARTFRAVGAQFAAMFAYDMLRTASRNLGWQTHYLNLVYTPRKAMSAVIAAEAMRRLPRMRSYGPYPRNTRFGDFRVSPRREPGRAGRAGRLPVRRLDPIHAPGPGAAPPDRRLRLLSHGGVRGRGDLLPRPGASGRVAARGLSRRGAGARSVRAAEPGQDRDPRDLPRLADDASTCRTWATSSRCSRWRRATRAPSGPRAAVSP